MANQVQEGIQDCRGSVAFQVKLAHVVLMVSPALPDLEV
jgi:hypothetical protein